MMPWEHEPTVHEGDNAGVTCSETRTLQLPPPLPEIHGVFFTGFPNFAGIFTGFHDFYIIFMESVKNPEKSRNVIKSCKIAGRTNYREGF